MTDPTRTPSRPTAGAGTAARGLLILLVAAVLTAGPCLLAPRGAAAQKDDQPNKGGADVGENPFPGKFAAKSLDGGTGWLNTSGEITLKDLRGKIVLLDFWTYCCINCMHVLPDLKYLEEKYPNEIVVIGVHSAKFENEKESENIRDAILRYEIAHPVINDSNMTVWRKYGVNSWPTLVVIDPEGKYVGYLSGEGNREQLDFVIGKLVEYHRAKGTLDETPVHFTLEREKAEPTPLRFPGKVLADETSGRLFISDSNHNRIVVAGLDGTLIDIIGSGELGAKDGSFAEASFDHPQGMALDGQTLYVADTENHLLRTVNLEAKTVSTLAGTGEQASFRAQGGRLRQTALNSPWDLQVVGGVLYIAMAGPHQLWAHELGSDAVGVYAGTGREDIVNGPLAASAFAQPSGLATDGKFLYVCDSEGSAIRKVPVGGKGEVTTIAGTHDLPRGRSLFEFGDRDGAGDKARLQHPLGIVWRDGTLYVADSYNHKIKTIIGTRVTTWLGTGEPGTVLDGPVQLSEPAGLTVAGNSLYIADTNNHRIVTVNLRDKTASELTISGLQPPQRKEATEEVAVGAKQWIPVPAQQVGAQEALTFNIDLKLPEGYKLNTLAPLTWKITSPGAQALVAADLLNSRQKAQGEGTTATVSIPLAKTEGKATLELALTYGYCRDGEGGLCKINTARWRIPVEVSAGAEQTAIQLEAGAE